MSQGRTLTRRPVAFQHPCGHGLAIRFLAEDNGVDVGTPTSHDSFVRNVAEEKGCEKDSPSVLLGTCPSSQTAWLLLFFCAVARVKNLQRTAPPGQGPTVVRRHDQCVWKAFWVLVLTPTRRRGSGFPRPFGRDRPSFLKIW